MMNTRTLLLVSALVFSPLAVQAAWFSDDEAPPAPVCATNAQMTAVFFPAQSVTDAVVKEIASAKQSVRIAAQHFNSKPVSIALLQAKRAGKKIDIVLDHTESSTGYSSATFFKSMGFPAKFSPSDTAQLSNYMVIDDTDVVVGNISGLEDGSTEKHSQADVLIIRGNAELAKQYTQGFEKLWITAQSEAPLAPAKH